MRIVVGMSGASGAILGIRTLEALRTLPDCEIHLVITRGAERTIELEETGYTVEQVRALADVAHNINNMGASIASGSFRTAGIIVAPCSMKTLSAIAHGYSGNLLTRSVDVCLKEKRRVVLVPREMPLGMVHLENMCKVTQYGAVVLPPMLTFYNHPRTIDDLVNHVVGKALLPFGLDYHRFRAWDGVQG